MTVSLARPGDCWVAPKNIVLAGAGAASILLPQLPQNRLPVGISAPQFGQSIPAFSAVPPASQAGPGRGFQPGAGFGARARASASAAAPRTKGCRSPVARSSIGSPGAPSPVRTSTAERRLLQPAALSSP